MKFLLNLIAVIGFGLVTTEGKLSYQLLTVHHNKCAEWVDNFDVPFPSFQETFKLVEPETEMEKMEVSPKVFSYI